MMAARTVQPAPHPPPAEGLLPLPADPLEARRLFLRHVEERIAVLVEGDARLERAARRLLLASDAKRARALVCLALGQAWHVPLHLAVELGAVVELVHGASLLHDDVVDVSDRRRGEPTVNHVEGNAFAVLCGDLVLAKALALLPSLPGGALMIVDALDVVVRMTRAAVIEVDARGRLPAPQQGLPLWREMAGGKTGALFGLCATLIGRAAQSTGHLDSAVVDDAAVRLERFGVAFQIVDDLKDLTGADEGKPRGQDIRERALNHPLLFAAENDSAFAVDVAAWWQKPGPLNDDVVYELCNRAMRLGAKDAVDEARAAVADGDGGARAALSEVTLWARGLVEQAGRLLQAL